MRIPLDHEERSFDVLATPFAKVSVELVEGDVSGGDENFLDGGVDSLQNRQIQKLRALLVQVRRQFPVLGHFFPSSVSAQPPPKFGRKKRNLRKAKVQRHH